MITLVLRTDKPEAEIGLYDNDRQLSYQSWSAHRELAETIHHKIAEVLKAQNLAFTDIKSIVVFKGPGSFTGLRIGITVTNALAYALSVPVVGSSGNAWVADGLEQLAIGSNDKIVVPEYGALPHITAPRK